MGLLGALLQGPRSLRRAVRSGATADSAVVGSLATSGAQVAVGALFALASLYLVRSFATHEYGRVAFGIYVYTLFQGVAGLGLGTGVLAETARGRGADGVAWPAVHALLWVRVLTVIPVLLVGFAWTGFSRDVLPAMASIVASIGIVAEFLIGVLAGQLRTRPYVLVVVSQPATFLLLLLLFNVTTAETGLLALGAALATSLLLAVAFFGPPRWPRATRPRASFTELAHAVGVARNAYLIAAMHIGFVSIPVILLGALGRYVEAATLSIVMTLVRFAPEALGLATIATFFSRLKAVDPRGPEGRELFATFARLLALFTIPAAVGLAVVGRPLLGLLFAGTYSDLAPVLAIGSVLVVLLPLEGLLMWTLVARDDGRFAIAGGALRLGVVLAACLGIVAGADDRAVVVVLVASVAGVLMSLAILVLRTRRTVPLPLPTLRIATYGLFVGAAYLGVRALMPREASDVAITLAAVVVTLPVLVVGSWLIGLQPKVQPRGVV